MGDLIVIPARFGSKRLPGKPLIPIAGRTLLERVVNVARQAARLADGIDIVVATDDDRIRAHAATLGVEAVMTAATITSGTGRALAAALARAIAPEIVVNLQGDAPFVPPSAIVALLRAARESRAAVATPVVRLGWDELDAMRRHKGDTPFSGTTCIRAQDGRALWFSKAIIPAIRDEPALRASTPLSPVLRHLGLYAYRLDALRRFEDAPPSRYEALEGLEQLRFLELGLDVMAIDIPPPPHAMSGIDTRADVALAEAAIHAAGDPFVPL
ncbi:3-deoxy-manno-octulosonate cytidylyltransferase [Sphingomonas profundi]|uniref:3-deoxy-manno-octulosonate cytidylyltransferase n=1 Tax=Alterirhizorhabdus profundi TaxID=2681549 RepID=UPI0012E863D9|nr:3-deoxy-manno-octulosonate cytidylyltransferase [Sphingomonas profundi]